MAASLNKEGFLTETVEQELAKQTQDMQIEVNDITREEEDSLLSEVKDNSEDEFPSAQVQRQKPTSNDEKSFKKPKDPKEIPST